MKNNYEMIKLTIIASAEFYGQKLSDSQIKMYADVLKDFTAVEIKKAYEQLRSDVTIIRIPLPAKILSIIKPQKTDRQEAVELATAIIKSLQNHGFYFHFGLVVGQKYVWEAFVNCEKIICESMEQALRLELGEKGLQVIKNIGGYSMLFSMWESSDETQFFAQLRDRCEIASMFYRSQEFNNKLAHDDTKKLT